jgi:adenine phosphoribosyltransferase
MRDLASVVHDVPDFPRPGIVFRDIMPLLAHPQMLRRVVDELAAFVRPLRPDLVVAAEARGFLFGPALAYALGVGFAPARKPGKLPRETISASYTLEYGSDALELQTDAVTPGMRVVIHDDLLATGGTAAATVELVCALGGEAVAAAFVVELAFLNGRARLAPLPVHALIRYDA